MMKTVLFIIVFFSLLFGGKAQTQTDGTLDTSFVVGAGFNNAVIATVVQPDGKILVGGWFTSYKGIIQNRIIRLNIDGSPDTSFNIGTGFNDVVNIIALQADGKILLGGNFTSYNDITQNRITRLNTDGSLDTTFKIGSGFNTPGGMTFINTIAIQSDGKILAGGRFRAYNDKVQGGIARLNTDGSLDTFSPGWKFNQDVETIAIQSDGKILVGGSFTYSDITNQNDIVRLNTNGTLDTSFKIGTGFAGSPGGSVVESIAIQSDGKILVGGYFTTYKDLAQNRIARLNTDGSLDTSFAIGTGIDKYYVGTIALQSDGKILLGGGFISYNGTSQRCITRLMINGSLDTSFNIGTGFSGTLSNVESISVQSDGKILVGGYFTTYKELSQNRIARLNGTATLSVSNFKKKEITLYPNPVSEILNFSEDVSNIQITELSGKMVTQISPNGKSVNLTKLAKGIYFITTTTKSGEIVTNKIVKK